MEVVIDSNILFRTLISAGELESIIFNDSLGIFAPIKLKEEFTKHKEEILEKSKLSKEDFSELQSLLFERVTFIPLEKYKLFISKAKELLGAHIKDEDFVALSLSKGIKLWTYEDLLFKIGIAISTKQLSEKLSKELS